MTRRQLLKYCSELAAVFMIINTQNDEKHALKTYDQTLFFRYFSYPHHLEANEAVLTVAL